MSFESFISGLIAAQKEFARMREPRRAFPAEGVKEAPGMTTQQTQTANALTAVDGFDAAELDRTESPIRGVDTRFKDRDYYNFAEPINVGGREFAAFDFVSGWQKLEQGCAPAYLVQRAGEPRPAQPHVDEKDWPLDLNGKPAHPWRWTRFLYLLDVKTGEISTFSSSTIGGRVAIDELRDQISFMRKARADAIPIVALASKDMATQFGSAKPRPYFRICGWKTRTDVTPQMQITGPKETFAAPTTKEILHDEIPDFNDGVPSFDDA
jgi:hypothetical protein